MLGNGGSGGLVSLHRTVHQEREGLYQLHQQVKEGAGSLGGGVGSGDGGNGLGEGADVGEGFLQGSGWSEGGGMGGGWCTGGGAEVVGGGGTRRLGAGTGTGLGAAHVSGDAEIVRQDVTTGVVGVAITPLDEGATVVGAHLYRGGGGTTV